MSSAVVGAVDLGASGGRVMAGRVSDSAVELREMSRFSNVPVSAHGTLYWDILRLYHEVLDGLGAAAREFPLASVGIDSWGVDYGLLDSAGTLIGNPVHYRDGRTASAQAAVPAGELYAVTGIQHLEFNTIHQLAAAAGTPALAAARTLLLIPDLLAYWLTGVPGAEVTNASTTALFDVRTQAWATGIMERAGIAPDLFPRLRRPGEVIGTTRLSAGPVPVTAVGSHDTASAVAAIPASSPAFAYISSGTWSLAGMELDAPVLSEASRLAGFTNETGVDRTIRYLRNVTGLWLVQECLRCWPDASLDSLLLKAGRLPGLRFVINPDDPVFLAPRDGGGASAGGVMEGDVAGGMPGRIVSWLADRGSPVPDGPAEIMRCIMDSLALAHRRALLSVQSLSGRHADVVHIVGGGSRNELLCQLTADAIGLPVIAGPAEATALGNLLVQARALGVAPCDLAGLRGLVRSAVPLRHYLPSGDTRTWQRAADRLWTGCPGRDSNARPAV
jgi:rhamnulokinase